MNNAVVTVYTAGTPSAVWVAATEPAMIRYARRCGADYLPICTPRPSVPEFPLADKWKAGRAFVSHKRIFFVDADVVLTDRMPNVFRQVPPGHASATVEGHFYKDDWHVPEVHHLQRSQGIPCFTPGRMVNAGLFVLDREHSAAYAPPPLPAPAYHCTEQHWFSVQLERLRVPFYPMPPHWQWMYAHRDHCPPQEKCGAIHYNGCSEDRAGALRDCMRREFGT